MLPTSAWIESEEEEANVFKMCLFIPRKSVLSIGHGSSEN